MKRMMLAAAVAAVTAVVLRPAAAEPLEKGTALLATAPPVAVVMLMQRWFVRGLIEPEK
ncbi:MAG: hypothetical protein ACM3JG_07745 [Thiohalocapsa sp.]